LSISLLGAVRIAFDGRTVQFKSRKSRAILAYLALSEGLQETRERLLGLLWSEASEQRAQTSLRQIVRELNISLQGGGYHGLRAGRIALELIPETVAVDLLDVVRDVDAQRVPDILVNVPRIAETIIADIYDVDPAYRDWVLAKRQTLHDRLLRSLEANLAQRGILRATRKRFAEALVNLDPTNENACRILMQLRAEDGDGAGAQRVYTLLLRLLEDDYDMEPSPATQQLYADVKLGIFEPPAVGRPLAHLGTASRDDLDQSDPVFRLGLEQVLVEPEVPPPPSQEPVRATKVAIIVQPFGQNGIEAERSHLVDGFRHHLIASLVRFREWYVADRDLQPEHAERRSTVSAYYAIEGTAYWVGDSISVVLTLRERDSDIYVWSDRFDLKLDNWFELQQRIVRRIAMSLNVQLSIERIMRLDGEPDVELEIYDRWLRGQALIRQFSPENWNRAARMFSDAIRDAPKFSPAYSSLAQMNNTLHMAHPGIMRDATRSATTLELARKSVALDPVDSRAQLSLGWALAMANRHELAVVPMELACELNPHDSWTLMSAALFHAFNGDLTRARLLANQSLEMTVSPTLAQWGYQGTILFLDGDYEAAINSTEQSQDVIHTLPAWRAAAHHLLGNQPAALMDGQRFLVGIRERWVGSERPNDAMIGYWLLHQYPISKPHLWERLRDGVRGAGIAFTPIRFGAW